LTGFLTISLSSERGASCRISAARITRAIGPGVPLAFHARLGKAAVLEQRGQAADEFTDPDLRSMEISDSFEKNRAGEDAAEEDEPHQGTALLHVVEHARI
jgi:hypothetical protein